MLSDTGWNESGLSTPVPARLTAQVDCSAGAVYPGIVCSWIVSGTKIDGRPNPLPPQPRTPATSAINDGQKIPLRGFAMVTRPPLVLQLLHLFGQLRHCLEEIGHQTVVRHLEDRRLGVLVDRDDRLRILHPREMLDRARDADRDV